MSRSAWLGVLVVVPLAGYLFWRLSGDDLTEARDLRPPTASAVELKQAKKSRASQPGVPPVVDATDDLHDAPPGGVPETDQAAEFSDDAPEEDDPTARARRIRLPVILAIRGNHPNPEARRDAMLNALRNSGVSDEAWTKQSVAVFDEWKRDLSSDLGHRLNWSSAQCFQAGCEVELSFPDRDSYERAAREFRTLNDDAATHGGRVQTPAVEGDHGEVLASWIMMRPDGSRS